MIQDDAVLQLLHQTPYVQSQYNCLLICSALPERLRIALRTRQGA